jgi:hypothetical protein
MEVTVRQLTGTQLEPSARGSTAFRSTVEPLGRGGAGPRVPGSGGSQLGGEDDASGPAEFPLGGTTMPGLDDGIASK